MKNKTTIPTKNIRELRNVLYEQIDLLRTGKADYKVVNTVANATSKIISTIKLELACLKLLGMKITENTVRGLLTSATRE